VESELSVEVRARGPSPAERAWRNALRAAGFQVAPVTIRVHPSQLLSPGGDKRAAEAAYRNYLAAEPENLMALDGLAFLLQHRGAVGEALQIRRQRYAAEARRLGVPDEEIDSVVSFLAASLGDGAAPPVPPAAYVEKMFDEFSSIYDRRQVMDLKYRGPALLREAVGQALGDDAKDLDVLDLGCGTGLAGAEFRPLARRQTGVDLSPAMLALARGRGVYDELQQAEIVRFLQETAERFDLIVAADVLNYFGDLSPVFTGIACVLRPGGHCAVTLEVGEGADYRLRGMRRYQHAGEYVQRTAATAGLARCVFDEVELRRQHGEPVRAWRGVWRRSESPMGQVVPG
jgi:predicted TPR repeat methyltransferase